MALASSCESVRIQIWSRLSEAVWRSASLIARASPMQGDDTCLWKLDPRNSFVDARSVMIQAIPTTFPSAFQEASVLQKSSCWERC